MRPPRFVDANGVLKPYSYEEAAGQELLSRVELGRFRSDGYAAHSFLPAQIGPERRYASRYSGRRRSSSSSGSNGIAGSNMSRVRSVGGLGGSESERKRELLLLLTRRRVFVLSAEAETFCSTLFRLPLEDIVAISVSTPTQSRERRVRRGVREERLKVADGSHTVTFTYMRRRTREGGFEGLSREEKGEVELRDENGAGFSSTPPLPMSFGRVSLLCYTRAQAAGVAQLVGAHLPLQVPVVPAAAAGGKEGRGGRGQEANSQSEEQEGEGGGEGESERGAILTLGESARAQAEDMAGGSVTTGATTVRRERERWTETHT